MPTSLRDLQFILDTYFPGTFPASQALLLLCSVFAVYPLLRLHRNQRLQPRQPRQTAWLKAAHEAALNIFPAEEAQNPNNRFWFQGEWTSSRAISGNLLWDLEKISELIGPGEGENPFHIVPPVILITQRLNCIICAEDTSQRSLRRHEKPQTVWLLDAAFKWVQAQLFVAHCASCRADYYPDRITYSIDRHRYQKLELNAPFLRVSKHGIWVSRTIAHAQERATFRFHAGWSNFADWLNETVRGPRKMTVRQSKRLFIEHFSRRLLVLHQKADEFRAPATSTVDELASHIRDIVGIDGGRIEVSLDHSCINCTHKKRYKNDLIAMGWTPPGDDAAPTLQGTGVAGATSEPVPALNSLQIEEGDAAPSGVPVPLPPRPPQQQEPPPGSPRGYVRLAVMDGKMVGHRTCALDDCKKGLLNYKSGRFCSVHAEMRHLCGIIPCGRNVSPGSLTCDDPSHVAWHADYVARFKRLTFPGVQRVMRRQKARQNVAQQPQPTFNVAEALPSLDATPGDQVAHTFRARSVYCVETVQWACGMPVGWGKCYRAESSPQVLSILNNLWDGHNDKRPSFVAYDDACDLLRHIATQNSQDLWLATTKFVVDTWHYIGHRATDVLCRLWCNPAPLDGSQPDLVQIDTDIHGAAHMTRSFNLETAEQLNAWLNRYEPQLRQMSDVTFDFFVHSLMLLYKEAIEQRIIQKEEMLTEEFWDDVL
ncbi:hypothetical protein BKA70DRAFT_1140333 [Coprinopsis sp. MPI-PUGE-AT-0042]|nr:hypothetical protein BKA70DRAFT_1140333 [Coprinopsis sp. MPI-PUGE-AT-0042]